MAEGEQAVLAAQRAGALRPGDAALDRRAPIAINLSRQQWNRSSQAAAGGKSRHSREHAGVAAPASRLSGTSVASMRI